jgi:O-antigen ligase
LAGVVLLAFALLLIASPGAMLGRLAGSLDAESNGRIYIWQELVPLTHEFRWFGTGLMGFDPVFLKYQAFVNAKRIDFAHNDFLQYLIEMGLIGFLPLLAVLAAIVWPMVQRSWTAASESPNAGEIRLLLTGCVAGLGALFLHSLVDFNLYIPANMLAFAWIFGFGSGLASIFGLKSRLSGVETEG